MQACQCAAVRESALDSVAASTVHLQLCPGRNLVPGLAQHWTHRPRHGRDAPIAWWPVSKLSSDLGRKLNATEKGIAPFSVRKWVDSWSCLVNRSLLVQQPMQA